MRFDSHQVNTGLEKHERRGTFGIGKNMVGAINIGGWMSGISSSSSLAGPGADVEYGGITGEV